MGVQKPGFDHAGAVAMVADGRSLADVAEIYGVSRQRIHQICQRAGVSSRQGHRVVAARDEAIARMRANGVSTHDITEAFSVAPSTVTAASRKYGITFSDLQRARLAPHVDRVRRGDSIRSIAIETGLSEMTVRRWAIDAGIESRHGPHRDLGHRKRIIPRLLQRGLSWREISKEIGEAEGRVYSSGAIHTWATKHMPELFSDIRRRA